MENNTSIAKLAQMGCGNEILNSCIERGQIQVAVNNCNQAIKYAKYCMKNHKEAKEVGGWKEQGEGYLLTYYNKLLIVESLANKYRELWQEKFCKSKLTAEKLLNY